VGDWSCCRRPSGPDGRWGSWNVGITCLGCVRLGVHRARRMNCEWWNERGRAIRWCGHSLVSGEGGVFGDSSGWLGWMTATTTTSPRSRRHLHGSALIALLAALITALLVIATNPRS
jgi:hypothetical protein